MVNFMAALLGLIANIALLGLATKLLWGWFVATVFGIADLTWGQAYGLAITLSYLTKQEDWAYERLKIMTSLDAKTEFNLGMQMMGRVFAKGIFAIIIGAIVFHLAVK